MIFFYNFSELPSTVLKPKVLAPIEKQQRFAQKEYRC